MPNDSLRDVRGHWAIRIAATLLLAASLQAADHSVEPIVSRIHREPIDSTGLSAVGYSKRLRALEIEFHDGLIYRYLEVPNVIYRKLLTAESKARFYNQFIKGKYRCLRVRAREE